MKIVIIRIAYLFFRVKGLPDDFSQMGDIPFVSPLAGIIGDLGLQNEAGIEQLQQGCVFPKLLKKQHALDVGIGAGRNNGTAAALCFQNTVAFQNLHALAQNIAADIQLGGKGNLIRNAAANRESPGLNLLNEKVQQLLF